ncbi:hypothetical protein [Brucella intermedia]|nr:hypothetical protein [Brucella intermedia]
MTGTEFDQKRAGRYPGYRRFHQSKLSYLSSVRFALLLSAPPF